MSFYRIHNINMLPSSISSLTNTSFLLGLGLGVADTSLLSRILNKQISDAALDNEDNESGGETVK